MLLNLLISPGDWWFLFPLLGWGLGLFLHGWSAFSTQVSDKKMRRALGRSTKRKKKDLRQRLAEQSPDAEPPKERRRVQRRARVEPTEADELAAERDDVSTSQSGREEA